MFSKVANLLRTNSAFWALVNARAVVATSFVLQLDRTTSVEMVTIITSPQNSFLHLLREMEGARPERVQRSPPMLPQSLLLVQAP
ncbi:hypothetical protein EDD22DRAFT_36205 [Suillus occidentalis]|nr:hypothetical protein EDD22DRAFT_36205 [Suillus occidentalis]